MGHLSYIADEVCKLFEKCAPELDDVLHGTILLTLEYIVCEAWHEYVTHSLRETRERDRQTLGGTRPDTYGQPNLAVTMNGADGDLSPTNPKPPGAKSGQGEDDEPIPSDNDAYNDQVRMVNLVCSIPLPAACQRYSRQVHGN
jgi:SIT4 phosphatase-associated protein